MIKTILTILKDRYPERAQRLGRFFRAKELTNINLNLCDKQQLRVLICYTNMLDINYENPCHANILHATQMIHYFIKRGYCVDFCHYADRAAFKFLGHHKYDVIIGQGYSYKEFCTKLNIPIRVNFVTENHPLVVETKYKERLDYFRERHPKIKTNADIKRNGVIDVEQFMISTHGILMSSDFNALNFKEFNRLRQINSNAIYNEEWKFPDVDIAEEISENRGNILWFGSGGFIHKGLDIVIDAVKELPDISLNCYGIRKEEYSLFDKLKGKNIFNRGRINVMSETFNREIVLKHNFIVFPSCSEGMSTAVATCMAYGIIPIITKECGFASASCMIILDDFHITCVRDAIQKTLLMSNDEILKMRQDCFKYAREQFSLMKFDESFRIIMDEILGI